MGSFGWTVDDLNTINPSESFSWANTTIIDADIKSLPRELFSVLHHLTSGSLTSSVSTCRLQAKRDIERRFFRK